MNRKRALGLSGVVAATAILSGCFTTVPLDQEEWTVVKSIPVVAIDDIQDIYVIGGGFHVEGRSVVSYTYAYETERGSIRQETTASLGVSLDERPLPVDVFEDVEPGEARVDVLKCSPVELDPKNEPLLDTRVCDESKRIEVHVPAGTVRLDTSINGPNN